MADNEEVTNVTVLGFDDMVGAENMLTNVSMWEEKGYFKVKDAVVVTRGSGNNDVEIKQTVKKAGKWSLGGGGIGLLAGLLLGGPIGGLVVGATVGAITGAMKDFGISDKFIREVSDGMPAETSTLFLMTTPDKDRDEQAFLAELKPFRAKVISTTVDADTSAKLEAALKDEG
ncbi:MAG: DUF1269 domain-containing protein [Caldilineaceae bacterium]|jgi:uncharacterized membrane protein